ncbi:MAG: iron-sulfur cluster assembly protein IscA, partial [Woeseiaceae bacterium]|nr:iron-sulfur cluster assembly protein IscA [Woeseiaceae bacterium]
MAISLTDSAATRVRNYLDARDNGIGLRLGVKKTGCSGYSYVINYAEKIEAGDAVFEDKGVTVVV